MSAQNRFAAIAEDKVQAPSPEVHVISEGSDTESCWETAQVNSTSWQTTLGGVGPINTTRIASQRSGSGRSAEEWRSTCGFREFQERSVSSDGRP